ncbi:MAG: response regulator [bacterium]
MQNNNSLILIVDDELGMRETLTDILQDEGYKVLSAENGTDAIKELKSRFFNVVFIDINLPDISGLEILKSIKQINSDTYSIMLTASTKIENSIKALNQGAYAYIVKPFDVKTIKDTIKKAISEQKLVLENKSLLQKLKSSNEALLRAKTEVDTMNKELETKIRERTKQLREQMTWTETIIDSLADGLCAVDKNWKITLFNRQAEIITGYKAEDVIAKDHKEIFRSMCHDCTKLIEKTILKGEKVSGLEIYMEDKAGRLIPLLVSAAPIQDKTGEILGAVQSFRDITENKQLQEQLIQASKLASMGELLANFTHEIKNPLNGMILFATLIKSETDSKSEVHNYADRILAEGTRIGKIAADVLTFSRQNRQEYNYEDIKAIIEATLSLTERQLILDGIQIERDFAESFPKLRINAGRIQQVFLNMINNAQYSLNKKFGAFENKKKKIIKLKVHPVTIKGSSWVRIEIEDNGVGINPRFQTRIFDPFFTTKPVGQGTGLGLSVSYGIIKDHHGEIHVRSEEKKFTRFIIDLPAFGSED